MRRPHRRIVTPARALASVVAVAAIGLGAASAVAQPSDLGNTLKAMLTKDFAAEKGRTWHESSDNQLSSIVQTPPLEHWGKPYSKLAMPDQCGAEWVRTGIILTRVVPDTCDELFHLRKCKVQADCTRGRCEQLLGVIADLDAHQGLDLKVPNPDLREKAYKLCAGHSDGALLDPIWRIVTSAEFDVDITTLSKPDDRFVATLRSALAYLSRKQKPIRVRILIGPFPVAGELDTAVMLREVTAGVEKDSKLLVQVGQFRVVRGGGWNHSKIVAADGKIALVGGHNMYTGSYLNETPAHDLSVIVTGSAAVGAHLFANELWNYTCNAFTNAPSSLNKVDVVALPSAPVCSSHFADGKNAGLGTMRVFAVGRVSEKVDAKRNPSDAALVTMINLAKSEVLLSQQVVGLPIDVPWVPKFITGSDKKEDVLKALAAKLEAKIPVNIVMPSRGANPTGYGGYAPQKIVNAILEYTKNPKEAGCFLAVAPLRFSDEEEPYKGPPGNHAKMVIVDRQLAYVGSQNLYLADLAEFGFLIDDKAAASQLVTTYWEPLWASSTKSKEARVGSTSKCMMIENVVEKDF